MTSRKSTKRALVSSALAILMCVAMLIGTTFAWFTDTASTGVNKIVSGNLKVDIIGADSDTHIEKLDFTKATGAEEENLLWEPGCRYLTDGFRIANNGNLALKWKAEINKDNIVDGKAAPTAKDGKSLLDVIDFYVVTKAADGTETAVAIENFTGNLAKGAKSGVYYIKGVMKTTAGNDYQDLTLDGITITVYATQDTVENDSYGKEYDKNAQYSDVTYIHATGTESLKSAITQSQTSEKPAYIGLAEGEYQVASADTIGSGATLAGEGVDKTIMIAQQVSVSKDDITIKDMTIKGDAPEGNYGAMNIGGKNTVIENVKFDGQGMNGDTKGISVTGENLTIRNSNISNAFRGIIFWDNIGGNNLIENCTIDNVTYTFNINAETVKPGTTLTVKNSTLNGWTSYAGCMSLVSFEKCNLGKSNGYAYLVAYADTTFTDCTFNDGYQIAAGDVSGKTITITNCKLADGTVITAENFAEKLGDVDNDMKNNTVIVNGDTVSWN